MIEDADARRMGGSTACGRTTSTTSCAACSPAIRTGTTAITRERRRSWRPRSARDGSTPGSARSSRGRRAAPIRRRVPMYRFVVCLQNHDQVGNRALGDRLHHTDRAGSLARRDHGAADGADDAAGLHGPGVGRRLAVPVLHRLGPGDGRPGDGGTARGVRGLPRVRRSGRARTDSGPAGGGDVRRQPPAMERAQRAGPCRGPAAAPRAAALRLEHRALAASDATSGEADALDDDTLVVRRADDDAEFLVIARLRGAGPVEWNAAGDWELS